MICYLAIPIKAVPKQRHRDKRVYCKNLRMFKRIHYTPAKTKHFEEEIGWHARKGYTKAPSEKPLKVTLLFYLTKPARPKFDLPAVKPDLDNYIKSVLDGLNKIVWKDDGQVCEILARKVYSKSQPMLTIMVEEFKLTEEESE